jgi:hypothetical protein
MKQREIFYIHRLKGRLKLGAILRLSGQICFLGCIACQFMLCLSPQQASTGD